MTASAYAQYMALPQGKYLMPEAAGLTTGNAMLVDMQASGVTDSNSIVPWLGTDALGTCTGLALWNRRTKKLVVSHNAGDALWQWKEAIAQVRDRESDTVDCHVIGGSLMPATDEDEHAFNDYMHSELAELADTIAATPNVIVKTFDVADKPRPRAFAVNAQNGKLVRGSTDIRPDVSEVSYFNALETASEMQVDLIGPDYAVTSERKR